jgi:hypothetical protein
MRRDAAQDVVFKADRVGLCTSAIHIDQYAASVIMSIKLVNNCMSNIQTHAAPPIVLEKIC